MRGRWGAVAIAAAGLIVVNLVARLLVRLAGPGGDAEFVIGLWSLGAMVVGLAAATFYWARRYLVPRVLVDAGVVIGASALVVTLVGPLVSDTGPFSSGVRFYLLQLFVCVVALTVGSALGLFTAMALGLDPKSRAWKRQAERVKTAPRQRQQRQGQQRQGRAARH
jgi:hypothetical protein